MAKKSKSLLLSTSKTVVSQSADIPVDTLTNARSTTETEAKAAFKIVRPIETPVPAGAKMGDGQHEDAISKTYREVFGAYKNLATAANKTASEAGKIESDRVIRTSMRGDGIDWPFEKLDSYAVLVDLHTEEGLTKVA